MRRAFLLSPIEYFRRISSGFNPRRRHPILNTIRAHRGVDYAAPGGTPIKAAGDGKIIFRGRKGGYGNAVIIQHGGNITTLLYMAQLAAISQDPWFSKTTALDEADVVAIDLDWVRANGTSPAGFDIARLNNDYANLTGQQGPFPVPPPAPEPTSTPDAELVAAFTKWREAKQL